MPRYGSNPKAGLDPRNCSVCGSSYQPYRDSQKTCSRPCHRRRPEIVERERLHKSRPEIRERKNDARRVGTNPERREVNLKNSLRRIYGLSFDRYEAMVEAQGNRCSICGSQPDPQGVKAASRLHVDHDHISGAVRDLLCNRCNMGVGYFLDDPARLRAAAAYIERHRQGDPT